MNKTFTLSLLASAAMATSLFAGPEGTCPASKGTTCASSTTTSTQCSATKGQYVMVKLKGGDQANISKAFGKLEGVSAVETCNESKFTKVAYSKDKVCADKIMAALKEAGYKVETQRVTYAVDGLSCGACCDKVGKALSKIKGVSDAKVCAESKQAVVDFDPARTSADKVMAAIDSAGFKASEALN